MRRWNDIRQTRDPSVTRRHPAQISADCRSRDVNFARCRSDMERLWLTIFVATLAKAAAGPAELVKAEGGIRERLLHGCDRDRPEFSHVRGRPLVSGVEGKSGLTHLHIVWSLGQVLLAADCVDAFEVEFQQVEPCVCSDGKKPVLQK